MGTKEWLLLMVLSILWGGSFLFVEIAVKQIKPFTLVFARVSLASFVLLLIIYLTGRKMPSSPFLWLSFLILGVFNNLIPFSLIAWGQTRIDSSLAAILNATTPIFSVVLAHFLTREERMNFNRIVGVLCGWLGVIILIGIKAFKTMDIEFLSQIAILIASCSYALAAIFGRRFKDMDSIIVAAGMLCCSSIMLLPLSLIFDHPWQMQISIKTLACVISLSVVSTAFAYLIYFYILAKSGATNILLVTFLIPVSAIFLGMTILNEQLRYSDFAGMLLIFIGLIIIDGRLIGK